MQIPIRKTFIILLFIGIFLMTLRPIADPDFWWHLRTGQWIIETGTIPHADPFSSTFAGKPWTAHEWLSDLFLYSLYCIGKYPILIIVFSLIITTTFYFVYRRCSVNTYISGFIVLLGVITTAPIWGVRPQILTFFLSSVYLLLLERYYKKRELKWILPLPFLTFLWVNLHAGYAMGLVIILVHISCDFLEWVWHRIVGSEDKHIFREIAPSGTVFLASLLAVMLNPNGPRMYIYPFETLTSPSMQQYIQEWFSPDFHQKEWQPLALLLSIFPIIAIFGREARIKPTRITLLLLFGYAALLSMRNVPLFILSAVPVLAELSDVGLKSARQRLASRFPITATHPPTMPGSLHIILIACAILTTVGRFTMVTMEQVTTEQDEYPTMAVDWILLNHPNGNIYNTYGWGGYLIWHLPEYPVFIDGRADLYGDTFIESYIRSYNTQHGWQDFLKANNVNLVLVEAGSNIGNILMENPEWVLILSDNNSVLFKKR